MTGRSIRVVGSRQPDVVALRGERKAAAVTSVERGTTIVRKLVLCVIVGRTCVFPRLISHVNISETRRWNAFHRDLLETVIHRAGWIKLSSSRRGLSVFLENEANYAVMWWTQFSHHNSQYYWVSLKLLGKLFVDLVTVLCNEDVRYSFGSQGCVLAILTWRKYSEELTLGFRRGSRS
jgi:hypothetical protein